MQATRATDGISNASKLQDVVCNSHVHSAVCKDMGTTPTGDANSSFEVTEMVPI